MITEEEYLKLKPLVEEYEQAEFQRNTAESLYCTECQALEAHDCFCDGQEEQERYCSLCSGTDGKHHLRCPYNMDPYDQLVNEGYD